MDTGIKQETGVTHISIPWIQRWDERAKSKDEEKEEYGILSDNEYATMLEELEFR